MRTLDSTAQACEPAPLATDTVAPSAENRRFRSRLHFQLRDAIRRAWKHLPDIEAEVGCAAGPLAVGLEVASLRLDGVVAPSAWAAHADHVLDATVAVRGIVGARRADELHVDAVALAAMLNCSDRALRKLVRLARASVTNRAAIHAPGLSTSHGSREGEVS